jgi:hypothetical protein
LSALDIDPTSAEAGTAESTTSSAAPTVVNMIVVATNATTRTRRMTFLARS